MQFELKFDLLALVLRQVETLDIFPFDDSVLGRFRHVVAGADMVTLLVVNLDIVSIGQPNTSLIVSRMSFSDLHSFDREQRQAQITNLAEQAVEGGLVSYLSS